MRSKKNVGFKLQLGDYESHVLASVPCALDFIKKLALIYASWIGEETEARTCEEFMINFSRVKTNLQLQFNCKCRCLNEI